MRGGRGVGGDGGIVQGFRAVDPNATPITPIVNDS